MAEGLFRHATRELPELEVSSAGVGASHGQAPSAHAVSVLSRKGIDIHAIRSRPLSEEIVNRSSYIFAMTRGHLDLILTFFPEAANRTFLVGEFFPPGRGIDVPDPIGQGLETYARCCESIETALPRMLDFIQKKTNP